MKNKFVLCYITKENKQMEHSQFIIFYNFFTLLHIVNTCLSLPNIWDKQGEKKKELLNFLSFVIFVSPWTKTGFMNTHLTPQNSPHTTCAMLNLKGFPRDVQRFFSQDLKTNTNLCVLMILQWFEWFCNDFINFVKSLAIILIVY